MEYRLSGSWVKGILRFFRTFTLAFKVKLSNSLKMNQEGLQPLQEARKK